MTTEERRAHNEALFRDLNERVKEIDERLESNGTSGQLEFLCECGDLDCATRFSMTRHEYEDVRRNPSLFVVIPAHVDDSIETAIEIRPGYVIVQKQGAAADVAHETDPRED
jgi:hypothetical protein